MINDKENMSWKTNIAYSYMYINIRKKKASSDWFQSDLIWIS